jgi:acetyl esterase
VLLFLHGGVWIVGNFENHKRLLRDLVVGSGQVGVFVEYTPLPEAKYPTQMEKSYAALKWVAAHADEFGADGSRIAVAGNSVDGDMTAALTLMTKDRNGPKISYQVLFILLPAQLQYMACCDNSTRVMLAWASCGYTTATGATRRSSTSRPSR